MTMRKIAIFIFILLAEFHMEVCANNYKMIISEYMQKKTENEACESLYLIDCIEGNFLNSGNVEILATFSSVESYYDMHGRTVNLIGIFEIINNIVSNALFRKQLSISDEDEHKYDWESVLNKKFRHINQGWILDLNKNGRDELLFKYLSGSSFGFKIFEVMENKIVETYSFKPKIYSEITVVDEEKSVYYRRYDLKDESNYKYKAEWNEEAKKYVEYKIN